MVVLPQWDFAMRPNIGFTGTQNRVTNPQSAALCAVLLDFKNRGANTLHSGDCIGADELAHFIWTILGGKTVGHIPTDSKKRAFCKYDKEMPAKPYLQRNRDIVIYGLIMVATPYTMTEEPRGSGTWATIRTARNFNRPLVIIFPNGEIVQEYVRV